jgi:hypothetical protein
MICDGSLAVWEPTVELGRHVDAAMAARRSGRGSVARAPGYEHWAVRFRERGAQAVAKLPAHLALFSADKHFR